jgi:hypothetical protein
MNTKHILIVGRDSLFIRLLYNYLILNVPNIKVSVVLEKKESSYVFLKRRINKIGFINVIGQLLFMIFIVVPQSFFSRNRIKSIISCNKLNFLEIPSKNIVNLESINSISFHNVLLQEKWSHVILCGSRIVSKKTLGITRCKFINIHAGITPFYRGVHGLYWALYNNDKERGGVTLHYVDAGIDTGNIISQEIVDISRKDNFSTYPYLQFCEGLKLLANFLNFSKGNKFSLNYDNSNSKLYYHPTIFQYLLKYITHNVK